MIVDGIQDRWSSPRSDRQPAPRSLLAVAVVTAVVAALLIATLDQPVARWIGRYEPSPLWDRAIDLLEYLLLLPLHKLALPFVLVGGMIVVVCVKPWRVHAPAWMFVAGTHMLSRLTTNWIKDATGRLRPSEWLHRGAPDETFGWEAGVSFPSGHVTLFASVLLPLAVLYPRTRPALAIVAFAMVARVAVNAHFLSDTVGGLTLVAAVTWAVAGLVRPCEPPRACPR